MLRSVGVVERPNCNMLLGCRSKPKDYVFPRNRKFRNRFHMHASTEVGYCTDTHNSGLKRQRVAQQCPAALKSNTPRVSAAGQPPTRGATRSLARIDGAAAQGSAGSAG